MIVKKQRKKAEQQGGMKYIAPIKGTKPKIEEDDYWYHWVERRHGCPVELYRRERDTGQVFKKSEKLEWIFHMKTKEQENYEKTQN